MGIFTLFSNIEQLFLYQKKEEKNVAMRDVFKLVPMFIVH
jgi:hypothetical protein